MYARPEGAPGTGNTPCDQRTGTRVGSPGVSIPPRCDGRLVPVGTNVHVRGRGPRTSVAGLMETRCCNPIVYMDEVDNTPSERGREIVLIHLIDPTANTCLRDRYFHGIDLDFSRCTFVFSFNNPEHVNPILLDRIKRIRIPPPTPTERCDILRRHIVPRVMRRLNTTLTFDDRAIEHIVSRNTESGMRQCEKDVDDVMSMVQLRQQLGVQREPIQHTDVTELCRTCLVRPLLLLPTCTRETGRVCPRVNVGEL